MKKKGSGDPEDIESIRVLYDDKLPMKQISDLIIDHLAYIPDLVDGKPFRTSTVAKEVIRNCASEFYAFLISECADILKKKGKKRITKETIIEALTNLGFDSYLDVIKIIEPKIPSRK